VLKGVDLTLLIGRRLRITLLIGRRLRITLPDGIPGPADA
jgi:hypothetical protein